MRNLIPLTALVMCMTVAVGMASDAFPIKLSRPGKPSDMLAVSTKVKVKVSRKWTDAGDARKPTNEEFNAALNGVETIMAVSAKGRPTALTLTVTLCTRNDFEMLRPGTVIAAENKNGITDFTVDGHRPVTDIKRVLSEIIYTARPNEPNADDEFGTDQPQKVGDTWPANGDQLAKATRLPYPVTGDDFKGQAKLLGVSTVNGKPTATVTMTDRCEFGSRQGTDGTTKNLKMNREILMSFPVAKDSHDLTVKSNFSVVFKLIGSTGTLEVRSEQASETITTAVTKRRG